MSGPMEEVHEQMTTVDNVRGLVLPLLQAADLDLYDLTLDGGILAVLVDKEGGADIDAIAKVSRAISRALDEVDPIPGEYALEVSTPGLERPLRTPDHYRRAVGMTASLKTKPGTEGDRRVAGTISAADDDTVTVTTPDGERTLRLDDIERARTTFEWGGQPKKNTKKEQKA